MGRVFIWICFSCVVIIFRISWVDFCICKNDGGILRDCFNGDWRLIFSRKWVVICGLFEKR